MPSENQKMKGNTIPLHHVSISSSVQFQAIAVYRTQSFRLEDPIPENPPDGTEGFISVRHGGRDREYHLVYNAKAFQWILKENGVIRGMHVSFVNRDVIDRLKMRFGMGDCREDDTPNFRTQRAS